MGAIDALTAHGTLFSQPQMQRRPVQRLPLARLNHQTDLQLRCAGTVAGAKQHNGEDCNRKITAFVDRTVDSSSGVGRDICPDFRKIKETITLELERRARIPGAHFSRRALRAKGVFTFDYTNADIIGTDER